MKVLQINTVCGYGSTGKIMVGLSDVMSKHKIENMMIYGYLNAPDGYNTYKMGSKIDRYIHLLNTYALDNHCFSSKLETKKMIKIIEDFKPDIVHLHNLHGYYLNIKVLFDYLKKTNIKIVWTLHDCWAFTGHCAHFDFIKCEKWKEGCSYCPQKKEYPSSFLKDNSKRNYKRKKELFTSVIDKLSIVTPSEWLKEIVEQSFLAEANIKVINNGINLEIFKYSNNTKVLKQDSLKNKFIILGVSNVWNDKKGYDVFNTLYDRLNRNEYEIILVGVSKEDKGKFNEGIITIDRTNNQEELANIYSLADVFVNPTLEDNFPTVNIESQACGTPVITFDTGGSGENISEDTGLIIEKGNIMQLIDAIYFIKNNPDFYTREKCRENSKKYDFKIKYQEYMNLYRSLME